MIGPRPCAYACAYVDPVFISQSHNISISTNTRRTNLSVFLVLMLMLMSTQFPLAYTYACAYAYAYALVKTRLKVCMVEDISESGFCWKSSFKWQVAKIDTPRQSKDKASFLVLELLWSLSDSYCFWLGQWLLSYSGILDNTLKAWTLWHFIRYRE